MSETILGLLLVTIFGIFVSLISISRFLKLNKTQNLNEVNKKQRVISIITMVLSMPATLFFIVVLFILLK
jgi:peptidoglycan biosynthesis protein MviN/MurJ (putative lipid II flippase)